MLLRYWQPWLVRILTYVEPRATQLRRDLLAHMCFSSPVYTHVLSFKYLLLIMCWCESVCMCVQVPSEARFICSPGTQIVGGCEPSSGCWELGQSSAEAVHPRNYSPVSPAFLSHFET